MLLSRNAASWDLDSAPTLAASTSPLRNSISVGMPRMPYFGRVRWLESMSSLQTWTRSAYSSDRAHAPVHHVRRRDDVGARPGADQRLLGQGLHGKVVHHVVALVQEAVVTMARVGIEGGVGDDPKVRARRLHRGNALGNEPLRIHGLAVIGRPEVVLDVRKQRHGRYAQVDAALRIFHQLIDAEPLDAGHRLDRLAPTWPSMTNIGEMRSSTVNVVSRTRRRRNRRCGCAACG